MIEREFESAGLSVPGFASVLAKLPVDAARAQKILQILLREKVLVKISSDLVFHRSTLLKLREMLAKYRKERGSRCQSLYSRNLRASRANMIRC